MMDISRLKTFIANHEFKESSYEICVYLFRHRRYINISMFLVVQQAIFQWPAKPSRHPVLLAGSVQTPLLLYRSWPTSLGSFVRDLTSFRIYYNIRPSICQQLFANFFILFYLSLFIILFYYSFCVGKCRIKVHYRKVPIGKVPIEKFRKM